MTLYEFMRPDQIVDARQTAPIAAGRRADAFPVGQRVRRGGEPRDNFDGVVRMANGTFRLVAVPLLFDDGTTIGALYIATSLDRRYAERLSGLSHARTAIVSEGLLLASTMTPTAEREFEAAVARNLGDEGSFELNGETLAYLRLVQIGSTSFYGIASIDESARASTRDAVRALLSIATGAIGLALLGSVWLAHLLTRPIGRLSSSLQTMTSSQRLQAPLPLEGSSRELDTLTETFNALIASVAQAEAQTEAAYTGAIRALAAALDARDP